MSKEIIVIGGGFAGVNLAKKLANEEDIHVTLVDQNNYNFFQPLLYQVATGLLEVSNISVPFRTLFSGKRNINFRLGKLLKIDRNLKKVVLSTGELEYDDLVLATGTTSNFFGMENIQKNALPMKTIDEAIEIRNYLLQKMEEATFTEDRDERRKLRNVVIAGAGPSGVEVAGMLAEMKKIILKRIYPEINEKKLNIYLVDGAPAVLPPMSESSQKYSYDTLKKMGVKIKLNTQVADYKDDVVHFADGDTIETKVLIWTAGVTSNVFEGIPEESYGKGRRLLVDGYNRVKDTEHIYAIGDTCLQTTDENFPDGHPQLASVAMQQGRHLAKNLIAEIQGKDPDPFSYFDKGSMAVIGSSKAVADLPRPKMNITGWFAWVMWLFVHLFQLVNYRNRIKTMYNWTMAYFKRDQSLGMIIRPKRGDEVNKEEAAEA